MRELSLLLLVILPLSIIADNYNIDATTSASLPKPENIIENEIIIEKNEFQPFIEDLHNPTYNSVNVSFSDKMDINGLFSKNNYTIEIDRRVGQDNITTERISILKLEDVSLDMPYTIIKITFNYEIEEYDVIKVYISNLVDIYGNDIDVNLNSGEVMYSLSTSY